MVPPILTLSNILLTFGGSPLLDGAEMSVTPGARICLVGRNGSGKSTFLKIAAGEVEPDGGEVFRQPDVTVRYLPQEPDLSGFANIAEFVEAGLAPGDEPHVAQLLLGDLGLSGDEDPAKLSGGERRRAALARALAPRPDVLLLDEPTNHLDLPAIEWLENELKSRRAALILISHDRRFLENLSDTVVWLDRGRTMRLDKGFAHFDDWRDEILEREETERHKLDRKIVAETAWLHKGVTARRKRNMGRLRALQDLRKTRQEQRKTAGDVKITASEAAVSGKRVIEAENISKSFAARKIVDGFSTRILRGDRVGVIDGGRLSAEGTRAELVAQLGEEVRIELAFGATRAPERSEAVAKAVSGVHRAHWSDEHLAVFADHGTQCMPALLSALIDADLAPSRVEVVEPDLEDVFLSLTGRALRD